MKQAPAKLSLRKFLIAMLAIAPLAILPSPVWATLPTSSSYSVTNGSASLTPGLNSVTISIPDRTVLQWGTGNFNIATTETYNFAFTTAGVGSVLNRLNNADTATINGQLTSDGRVFVLAPNGTISIGNGAIINTVGGFVGSTINETSDGAFITTGNLTFTGGIASNGNISIGTGVSLSGGTSLWGNQVAVGSAAVNGDLFINSNSTAGVVLGSAGNLAVGGNLTVVTNNGTITQGATTLTVGTNGTVAQVASGGPAAGTGTLSIVGSSGNQTASFTTGGNVAIDLSTTAANDFEIIQFSAGTGAGGNVAFKDGNIVTIGASTIGGTLTATAVGTTDKTAIGTSGAVAVTGTANFQAVGSGNSGISIGSNSTFGGTVVANTSNSSVSISAVGNLTTGAIDTGTGNKTGITLASTGILNVGGVLSTTGNGTDGGSISLTGSAINQTAAVTITSGTKSSTTFNGTAGNVSLNAVTTPVITVTATGGQISQNGGIITSSNATGTSSFTATNNITLNQANNIVSGQIVKISGATVGLTNIDDLTLGTTNTTGNLTLALTTTGKNLVLGTGLGTSAQNISVGGVLAVTTTGAGGITDNNYSSFNIPGGLNLTTGGGSVVLDAATANGALSPSVQFGQVKANVGAGSVTVGESTTLNLGNITAATLVATSKNGSIVNSGDIATTTTTVQVPANGTITLSGGSNNFGTLNLLGGTDATVTSNTTALSVAIGSSSVAAPGNTTVTSSSLGQNITVASIAGGGGNVTINAGGNVSIAGAAIVGGNLSLTAGDSGGITQTGSLTAGAGYLNVAGTTTVSAGSGPVTLSGPNDFNSLVLGNISGATTVNDINNLTLSGSSFGAVTATAGANSSNAANLSTANTWALTLGNLSVNALTATAGNGGGGNSSTITQAAGTNLHVETNLVANTNNANIVLGNNGNSAGRVSLYTGAALGQGSASVTYVEDGTVKLGNLSNTGSASIKSNFGSIIEDLSLDNNYTNNGTTTLTASNGSVTLAGGTHTSGATAGNLTAVTISAPNGAAAVSSTGATLTLGAIQANSLTVIASGNLSQSAALNIYGTSAFTAGNNITLTNNSNNFGRISLTETTVNKNISITEAGTLNLGTVSMGSLGNSTTNAATGNGTFTATSLNGDIIDTGLGGAKFGGLIAGSTVLNANAVLSGSGVVTLNAQNGNIVIDDPTSDFHTTGGVVFNAKNVTLAPLGRTDLVLGGNNTTSAAGNLTVTSAIGNVTQASGSTLSVTGDAFFQTGNGNITLTQSTNKFGTVKFTGNQVKISESDDIALVTGSSAIGIAEFVSGGNITIVNRGGIITLGSTGNFTATANITLPKLLQAVGNLTVNAAGTKDLSALSQSTDLNGKTPVNLGTGTYIAPSP